MSHVLILGTGIAGLSTALKLAGQKTDISVTLIAKANADEGSTRYAQGGIASVWSKQDSFEEHKHDTHIAGAGLCNERTVEICVKEGPARVQELIDWGVEFTKADHSPHEYDLHREGGHGKRRILHADDLTGLAIEKALLAQARKHPNIKVLEDHCAIDLITEGKLFQLWRKPGRCLGAYVLNCKNGQVETHAADLVVLATGGAGKVYLYTSNPDVATGDGIAMAYRAGAEISNLEFTQFHPTCLYHPTARTFLITEALRGEGAVLKNLKGESFMEKYHEQGSLAPRDVVARAIDHEMKRTGDKHVWLDCAAIAPHELETKFPNIYQICKKHGIDIAKQLIPVVPAAHYMCGGVRVDEYGRTSIENLYAVGEVSCTGLHGANRLASNSLLEAVVFANRVVEHSLEVLQKMNHRETPIPELPGWDTGSAVAIEDQIDIAATWLEIRTLMWNTVGIVRSNKRLERAKKKLEVLKSDVQEYYWSFLLTKDLIELRNLVTVADLIVDCALMRKESRGLHYTVDYPKTDDINFKRDTTLSR